MPTIIPRDIDRRYADALTAEFVGTLLLQFLASISGSSLGYGLSYAVLLYATKHVSGGHLNPALTVATAISHHLHWIKATGYIIAQIAGAIVGALLEALLVPGLHVGHNAFRAPGCFYPGTVSNIELFGWELVLTAVLVYVAFASHFTEPGHRSLSPLALGLTVWVLGEAGGLYTGAAVNPARVIAAAVVFLCTPQKKFWLYLLGEILGAAIAAAFAAGHFGHGAANSDQELPFLDEATRGAGEPLLGDTREGGAVASNV
mmetsp:Transcript_19068/g.57612  ORF Transcript_19068/g.57612 Transcript_19068/m.57612 type:complete len:260 (+) Transcript_19068:165-944(+)